MYLIVGWDLSQQRKSRLPISYYKKNYPYLL